MKCSAARSDGESCGNHAIRGGDVCRYHGGSAPQVRAAANRRRAEADAREAARRKLVKTHAVTDPLAHLAELAAEVAAVRAALAGRMAEAPDQMPELLGAWGSAATLFNRVLVDWLRLRADARLAEVESGLTESTGQMIAGVIRVATEHLPLAIAEDVRKSAAKALRALAEARGQSEIDAVLKELQAGVQRQAEADFVAEVLRILDAPESSPPRPALPLFENEATPDPPGAIDGQDEALSASVLVPVSVNGMADPEPEPEVTRIPSTCRHQQVSRVAAGDVVVCAHCSGEWSLAEARKLGIWYGR